MNEENTWVGPTPKHCQVCGKFITNEFIDGKTSHGPWAIMCGYCHSHYGVGFGIGRGQKYKLGMYDGKEQFYCVEG